MTHSACCDLYHWYGLPVWGEAGCSDSKSLDEQAAMESMASIMMAALDGCNLVHDVGYLGQGLIGSPAAIVMCDEIISYVKRMMKGFDISSERLGLDVIDEIGPGGNFLSHEHTLKYFREEHWVPQQINRQNPEAWLQKGGDGTARLLSKKHLRYLKPIDRTNFLKIWKINWMKSSVRPKKDCLKSCCLFNYYRPSGGIRVPAGRLQ
ncbi:MAG: trimethylamine methyltransferase family protein [Deltaproteobacteria bacterium]|nr:trimethylamine methyltransferase family protein [Deltaproteobacteria bacterium]